MRATCVSHTWHACSTHVARMHTQVFGHIRAHPHAWHACSTHVDLSHACPCQKCLFSDIRVTCVLHACRMRPHAWHACSTHVDACTSNPVSCCGQLTFFGTHATRMWTHACTCVRMRATHAARMSLSWHPSASGGTGCDGSIFGGGDSEAL